MKDQEDFRKRKRPRPSKGRLTKATLNGLVKEAIVDCYNESEQATGLYTMIEENLKVRFETEVLGVPVTTPLPEGRGFSGYDYPYFGLR